MTYAAVFNLCTLYDLQVYRLLVLCVWQAMLAWAVLGSPLSLCKTSGGRRGKGSGGLFTRLSGAVVVESTGAVV